MLKLDRVSKFYSANGVVTSGFSKVSMELDVGEFVAITGESGSGKSTLLNVISGLDSYEEGEMYIYGQTTSGYDSNDMENYRKRYIGNIFQTFNLINNYTVYQNVELVLLLSGYKRHEIKNRVNEIINRVGLSDYKKTKASKLSGGQKQRVAIARALAKETPIIVADEPTGNLDVASAADIIKLLAELAQDKLIVIVTHNYEQVEPYVTRKITMHDGRVVEDKVIKEAAESSKNVAADITKSTTNNITEDAPATTTGNPITRKEQEAPQQKTGRVREARHDGLSFGNTLRLGTRNTFSLLAKFILLLFVFLFLCTGTFASYANNISLRRGSLSSYVWGSVFSNTGAERIVVKRPDEGELTSRDFTALSDIPNIKTVVKNDLTMDHTYWLTDVSLNEFYSSDDVYANVWLYAKNFDGDGLESRIVKGHMPKDAHEAVLLFRSSEEYIDTAAEDIFDQELYISAENGRTGLTEALQSQMKIVGYGFWTDEEEEEYWNDPMYYECFICTNDDGKEVLDSIIQSALIDMEIRTYEAVYNIGMDTDYTLVPWDELEPGEVYIPTAMANDYPWGSWSGESVTITAKGRYESKSQDFRIAYHYGPDNYQWILGISRWEDVPQGIYMNEEDILNLFPEIPVHQVSLLMEEPMYAEETLEAVEAAGYSPLYVNTSARGDNSAEKALTNMLYTGLLVLLLGVLFFVSYFIIKLIFKSRTIYFSTVRMLGGSRSACSGMLLMELLVVFHIAFGAVTVLLWKIKDGTLSHVPAYLSRLAMYLSPRDFIFLYIVVLIMTILLAVRYSGQMFKKTAMNAYKEEV